jgi:hypothetical protein
MQQAWSRRFGTVMLAANNGGDQSVSGSGIYHAGEPLVAFFNASLTHAADNRVLVATVPVAVPELDLSLNLPTSDESAPLSADVKAGPSGEGCGVVGLSACSCEKFTPVPGKSWSSSVTYGNITCTASVSVRCVHVSIHVCLSLCVCVCVVVLSVFLSPVVDSTSSPATNETFAVVAYTGVAWFLEPIPLQLCALVPCAFESQCLVTDPYLRALYKTSALFDQVSLSANFTQPDTNAIFFMSAAEDGQILSAGVSV